MSEPKFVAEVKLRDPFSDTTKPTGERPADLMDLAIEHGDIISIHTHIAWGGTWTVLNEARKMTDKPILAKGAHMFGFEVQRCFDYGADYVLTMNDALVYEAHEANHSLFDVRDKLWYEGELWMPESVPVVVNARRLSDGKMRERALYEYEVERQIGEGHPVVQASGITTPKDVLPGVYAYIVGTRLPDFIKARACG